MAKDLSKLMGGSAPAAVQSSGAVASKDSVKNLKDDATFSVDILREVVDEKGRIILWPALDTQMQGHALKYYAGLEANAGALADVQEVKVDEGAKIVLEDK